ncbi:MAG: hypothetical protein AAGI91_09810 [Bacteroidota bacterium]
MTQILKQAIEEIATLPEDRQEMLAHRILVHVEEERRKEADLLAALDVGLNQLDRGESGPVDFEEVKRRGRERLANRQAAAD